MPTYSPLLYEENHLFGRLIMSDTHSHSIYPP